MDQQPKIPTLKDAQKPQVKIKGMGAGLTLFDRLKQFKKKDLAFILAGLGTLFMAPLAEHFMMAPENGSSDMAAGFRGGGGTGSNGLFGSGSSPYENGNNSIAQGGAIGGSGDIITPLNVRDPSALVMGPGAAQQPPAGSAAPAVAPTAPARSETDYKDALAGAASRAASAAVKRAPLPMPKVSLSGSQLRGLGVAGGGASSASGSLGPIGGAAGGTAGTGGGGLNLARSAPGYRGTAGARGSSNPSGLDGTKKAGANAGDQFSRTGSALAGLNAAANETIPTGNSGFNGNGQGGVGANDKPGGGSGPGGSKSVGESLAFLAAKQRQEENLKLEFEKRKLKDNELLMYGIRNDVAKASAGKIGEALTKTFMCKAMNSGCPAPDDDYDCGGTTIKKSQMKECGKADKDQVNETTVGCWKFSGPIAQQYGMDGKATTLTCYATGKGKGTPPSPQTGTAASDGFPGMNNGQVAAIGNLGTVCSNLDTLIDAESKDGKAVETSDTKLLKDIRVEATKLAAVRDALYQGQGTFSNDCKTVRKENAAPMDAIKNPVAKQQRDAFDKLSGESGFIPTLKKDANPKEGEADAKEKDYTKDYNEVQTVVAGARKDLEAIRKFAGEDLAAITPTKIEWSPALLNIPSNKEKLAAINGTMTGTRTGLTASLKGQILAQDYLDGGAGPNGAAAKDKTKVLPQLQEIISVQQGQEKSPLAATRDVNAKYDKFVKDNKIELTLPNNPEKFEPTGAGIALGAGSGETGMVTRLAAAQKAVDDAKAKAAKEGTTADLNLSKDNETVKATNNAKSTAVGVRTAQTTWLDNVNAMVTTARASVPNGK